VEYWNLRKLIKERDEMGLRLAKPARRNSTKAHDERAEPCSTTSPEINQELLEKRIGAAYRARKTRPPARPGGADAREVRRSHVGLKMKLEVLTSEADVRAARREGDRQGQRLRLIELPKNSTCSRKSASASGLLIEEGDVKVDEVDAQAQGRERGSGGNRPLRLSRSLARATRRFPSCVPRAA
jgi:hypothetical protein